MACALHCLEHSICPADTWSPLCILFPGVAHTLKLRHHAKHAPTKPHSIALHGVAEHIDINRLGTSRCPQVNCTFDISLDASAKVTKHCGAALHQLLSLRGIEGGVGGRRRGVRAGEEGERAGEGGGGRKRRGRGGGKVQDIQRLLLKWYRLASDTRPSMTTSCRC